jgi:hypothetical protein
VDILGPRGEADADFPGGDPAAQRPIDATDLAHARAISGQDVALVISWRTDDHAGCSRLPVASGRDSGRLTAGLAAVATVRHGASTPERRHGPP